VEVTKTKGDFFQMLLQTAVAFARLVSPCNSILSLYKNFGGLTLETLHTCTLSAAEYTLN